MGIIIVGLGPGDGRYLTKEAWEVLSQAPEVYLRTARHPAAADLPPQVKRQSFDEVYESAERFADVYETIAARVLELGTDQDVVYAVPGHPFMGESTVVQLVKVAQEASVPVRVISGLSFLEPILNLLEIDGMDGVQILDAISVAEQDYPLLSPDRPVILGQVYNQLLASELKLNLSAVYPDEHEVILIHGAGTDAEMVEKIPLYEVDRSEHIAHLTTLVLPPRPQRSDLSALAEAVATLRGPNGCPWDQKQTPQSMRDGFLEEVSEVLDTLDRDDTVGLEEELGDVLLHVTMQAQMAAEEGLFTLSDVISGIVTKIVRRHPHVWGDIQVNNSGEVVANWEAIKAQEKVENGQTESGTILNNIPISLPALARALKIQKRVAKVGFDWQEIDGVYDKLQEEVQEVQSAESPEQTAAEIGDLLFAVVNLARWLDVDPEVALREANLRFMQRFMVVEALAAEQQQSLKILDIDALERLWTEAKSRLAA